MGRPRLAHPGGDGAPRAQGPRGLGARQADSLRQVLPWRPLRTPCQGLPPGASQQGRPLQGSRAAPGTWLALQGMVWTELSEKARLRLANALPGGCCCWAAPGGQPRGQQQSWPAQAPLRRDCLGAPPAYLVAVNSCQNCFRDMLSEETVVTMQLMPFETSKTGENGLRYVCHVSQGCRRPKRAWLHQPVLCMVRWHAEVTTGSCLVCPRQRLSQISVALWQLVLRLRLRLGRKLHTAGKHQIMVRLDRTHSARSASTSQVVTRPSLCHPTDP